MVEQLPCRDPVYDFSWLQSNTGTEAMTVSTDGQVLWWDTRRLGQPLEDLTLREKASAAGAMHRHWVLLPDLRPGMLTAHVRRTIRAAAVWGLRRYGAMPTRAGQMESR